jgi:hypothetical protein
MLKNISNLKGAQKLTNNEQKAINGGICQGQYFVYNTTQAICVADFGFWIGGSSNKCLYGSCN